jgi:hypothetical protein
VFNDLQARAAQGNALAAVYSGPASMTAAHDAQNAGVYSRGDLGPMFTIGTPPQIPAITRWHQHEPHYLPPLPCSYQQCQCKPVWYC